ncbi:MAG: tRNA-uridine aminocarboxypropyltransferase [Bacteriovoracia bacterium]
MRMADYLKKRKKVTPLPVEDRGLCLQCLRSPVTCICAHLKPFDPKTKFVILTHLREAQNRIGTGRLSHLMLTSSEMLIGTDFTGHARVNELVQDGRNHCVILYPGEHSMNLSTFSPKERGSLFPESKALVVFVIDGTWFTAPKILRLSKNLQSLPKICFDPPAPSRFRIRRQPKPYCHSTVEAIHHTIDLLGDSRGFNVGKREHDHLLYVFDQMVEQQIDYGARPKLFCQWSPKKRPRA